jgi:hypothetical protein
MKILNMMRQLLSIVGMLVLLTVGYVVYSQTGSVAEKLDSAANGFMDFVHYDNTYMPNEGESGCVVGWEKSICFYGKYAHVIDIGRKDHLSLPTRILTAPIETAKDAYENLTSWFKESDVE